MADETVHINAKQRVEKGERSVLLCGEVRAGAKVSGDLEQVTCDSCIDAAK